MTDIESDAVQIVDWRNIPSGLIGWMTAQVRPDGSNSISAGDFLGFTQVIRYSTT